MTCCTADSRPATTGTDPTKHVNYVLGMVLGVDDLTQDFTYLADRIRGVVRELDGYGTVRGLAVRRESDATHGPRIRVAPGLGVSPSGQLVCVGAAQCCDLNPWLERHARDVDARLGTSAGTLALHVVLRPRERLTDDVPIPGEPCRAETELTKPSRVQDTFCLALELDAPRQREEDAVRAFVAWLRRVPVEDGSPPAPIDDLLDAIRDAARPWLDLSPPLASPPDSPPWHFMDGDPPAGLAIPRDACLEYLRAAFLLWVTELRPAWIARYGACHAGGPQAGDGDDALLLADVTVPVVPAGAGRWRADDTQEVALDESRRPWLLHLRLLQEWMLSGCAASGGPESPLAPPLVPAASVQEERNFGQAAVVGVSLDYARADHTHGTPALPAAGGDLSGALTNARVDRIQNVPVVTTGGANGSVLAFDGTAWRPVAPAAPPTPIAPGTTVVPGNAFGLPAAVGTQSAYARVDHSHGTPVLPALGQDLAGASLTAANVVGLRGIPIAPPPAASPQPLMLVLQGGQWQTAPVPTGGGPAPAGRFVERATDRPFAIVAAGLFSFGFNAQDPAGSPISVDASYNDLQPTVPRLTTLGASRTRLGYRFTFKGFEPGAPYVVKLTPEVQDDAGMFLLVYAGTFTQTGGYLGVQVLPRSDGAIKGRIHLELSRFE